MTDGMMDVDAGAGRQRKVRVDYPGNSKKGQEPETPRTPLPRIVTGEVTRKKEGMAGKFFHSFLSEDTPTVLQYVVMEVLLPAAKNTISDVVSQGIERMLFGDSRPRARMGGRPGYTNYSGTGPASPGRPADPRPALSRQARANHEFDDIIIATRAEAEDVLERLRDLINSYQVATVADLYDLVGLTGEFTDNKWGWTDLRSASIRVIRGGYLLDLPRTDPIV